MTQSHIYTIFMLLLFTSCTSSYYQLYETKYSKDVLNTEEGNLLFNNDTISLQYDLWGNMGNMKFAVHNLSDEIIYIDLFNSFFIVNDKAFDYENLVIAIPPKSHKTISEYFITGRVYIDCDLKTFPKDDIQSVEFNQESSPIRIRNFITYSLSNEKRYTSIENSFYVNKITNMSASEMHEYKYKYMCGKKTDEKLKVLKFDKPSSFYLYYYKSMGNESGPVIRNAD